MKKFALIAAAAAAGSVFLNCVAWSSTCLAAEQLLVTITSDALPKGDTRKIHATVDGDNNITGFRMADEKFTVAEANKGITLLEREGRKVVTIRGNNIDGHGGGELVMSYLKNGVTNVMGTFKSELRNEPTWGMYFNGKAGRVRFTNMFFKKKEVMGQTIGIETIQVW